MLWVYTYIYVNLANIFYIHVDVNASNILCAFKRTDIGGDP